MLQRIWTKEGWSEGDEAELAESFRAGIKAVRDRASRSHHEFVKEINEKGVAFAQKWGALSVAKRAAADEIATRCLRDFNTLTREAPQMRPPLKASDAIEIIYEREIEALTFAVDELEGGDFAHSLDRMAQASARARFMRSMRSLMTHGVVDF
jgi:hypothetical protein